MIGGFMKSEYFNAKIAARAHALLRSGPVYAYILRLAILLGVIIGAWVGIAALARFMTGG